MAKKIKPITLNIEKKLWFDYKMSIPRTDTLNDRIVALIEREVAKVKRKQEKEC